MRHKNEDFMNFGRVMPQKLDSEGVVIGSILTEPDNLYLISDRLRPEMFYNPTNRNIYNAIIELRNDNKPIDLISVKNKVHADDPGALMAMVEMTNGVIRNTEHHALIVIEAFMKREMIRVCTNCIRRSFNDEDAFEVMDELNFSLAEVEGTVILNEAQTIDEIIRKSYHEEEGGEIYPTGFELLDEKIGGWMQTDFVVIAARPSMGKSALITTSEYLMAKNDDRKIGMFSLEMSKLQVVNRMRSYESRVPTYKITRKLLNDTDRRQIMDADEVLSKMNIVIDDQSGLSINEIRSRAVKMVKKHGVELIVIDYLQLISGASEKNKNRENDVAEISRKLKTLAKDLNVPVIALSQLSRAVESRGGVPKPKLSDLRESGAIEQDADIVIFIMRPEYYEIPELDFKDYKLYNIQTDGLAWIGIAKQRNGSTGSLPMTFHKSTIQFDDYDLNDEIEYPEAQF